MKQRTTIIPLVLLVTSIGCAGADTELGCSDGSTDVNVRNQSDADKLISSHINRISFCEMTENVNAASLTSADSVEIRGINGFHVTLDNLTNVESLTVAGHVRVTASNINHLNRLSFVETVPGQTQADLPNLETASFVGLQPDLKINLDRLLKVEAMSVFDAVLPSLVQVDDLRTLAIESLEVPALRSVGILRVGAARPGGEAILPGLRDVETIMITGDHLVSLAAEQLVSANYLSVKYVDSFSSISLPQLSSLQRLEVEQAPVWSACEIDALIAKTNPSTVAINNVGLCP